MMYSICIFHNFSHKKVDLLDSRSQIFGFNREEHLCCPPIAFRSGSRPSFVSERELFFIHYTLDTAPSRDLLKRKLCVCVIYAVYVWNSNCCEWTQSYLSFSIAFDPYFSSSFPSFSTHFLSSNIHKFSFPLKI